MDITIDLPSLTASKNDAEDICNMLSSDALGYTIFNDKPFIGSQLNKEDAFSEIYEGMKNFFNNADTIQTLLFYFSGHAILGGDGEAYLAMPQTDLQYPMNTSISFTHLIDLIASTRSNQVICIIDSCYSGKLVISKGHEDELVDSQRAKEESQRADGIYERVFKRVNQKQSKVIFTSSRGLEYSFNTIDKKNGLFTYYLIEGLRGIKDILDEKGRIIPGSVDEDGNVTPTSIHRYITYKIGTENKGTQRPLIRVNGERELIIARYPKLKTPRVGPSTYLTSDKWTDKDTLGFYPYSYAIAKFIIHEQTLPPLCISIHAPWGGGKTSLMKMIQKELDPEPNLNEKREDLKDDDQKNKHKSHRKRLLNIFHIFRRKPNNPIKLMVKIKDLLKDLENPTQITYKDINPTSNAFTIWFNAWKYENTEQIWAGLADAIISQVAQRLGSKGEIFLFQLHLQRQDLSKIRKTIYNRVLRNWWHRSNPWIWSSLMVALTSYVVIPTITSFSKIEGFNHYLKDIGLYGGIIAIVVGIIPSLLQWKIVQQEPAQVELQEFVEIPDYASKLGFVHNVEKDLQRVFEIIGQHKLIIFIDDLDRCTPSKIASVMEAINLFLAGELPDCIFVLGLDPSIIAASLEEAHKGVIEIIEKTSGHSINMPIGWRFMDKFVQLPFGIPPPKTDFIDNYIETYVKSLFLKEVQFNGNTEEQISPDTKYMNHRLSNSEKNINKEYEKNLEIEKSRIRTLIDSEIEHFTDNEAKINDLMIKSAKTYCSNNPRELKRFLNTFRMHFFIRAVARKSEEWISVNPSLSSLSVSDEQLVNWVILSLKWPEVIKWLTIIPTWPEYNKSSTVITYVKDRLALLENLGEKCNLENKDWLAELEHIPELESSKNNWVKDKGLISFFRYQAELPVGDRLSSAAGMGLY